jgi:hypothetical protein
MADRRKRKKSLSTYYEGHIEVCISTSCRAVLNKQKCLFAQMENKKVKQVLSGDWFQWEAGEVYGKGEGG